MENSVNNSKLDNNQKRVAHSKNNNLAFMINDGADKVVKELFDSLKNRYQNNFESMKGSEFVFDYIHLLYHMCHKINPNHGGSYTDSPDWIKSKIATTNPFNRKGNRSFQYAAKAALIYEEIKIDPQRITKIEPFVNKYNWEGIYFPPEKDDWKKFEKHN